MLGEVSYKNNRLTACPLSLPAPPLPRNARSHFELLSEFGCRIPIEQKRDELKEVEREREEMSKRTAERGTSGLRWKGGSKRRSADKKFYSLLLRTSGTELIGRLNMVASVRTRRNFADRVDIVNTSFSFSYSRN